MDIGLNPSNSAPTNISGVPSKSADGSSNGQQEERETASVTTVSNIDTSQVIKNAHLMLINPKENCSELIKLSHVSSQKYSKPAKTDTANEIELQVINEEAPQKSNAVSCENERSPSSLFM